VRFHKGQSVAIHDSLRFPGKVGRNTPNYTHGRYLVAKMAKSKGDYWLIEMKSLPQAILDEQIKNTVTPAVCSGKTKVAVRKWRYGNTRIILKVKQVRKDSRIIRELSINYENGQDEPFYTF